MLKTCDLVLAAVRDCLPPDHTQNPVLTAKAQNRRGDCLLLLDRAEDALTAYDTAIRLSPDDAYPVFNRGRAHRALGQMDEARTDFTNAAGTRFKQPKARKLAQEALEELK
jgi:tetratricopeptide (TPR) repeat protein